MKTSLRATKDYTLFDRCKENRPVTLSRRRALRASMQEHGWIPAYPMHVARGKNGRLVIRDGQHRFEIAKELGLIVWFVECDDNADIAKINNSQCKWGTRDYAASFAQRGNPDYQELLDYCDRTGVPVLVGAALLHGTVTMGNVRDLYVRGDWTITDRDFAESVAVLYRECGKYCRFVKTRSFIDAIAACARVPGFRADRLVANVRRCPEKLIGYSNRDGMLLMLEAIYNFGQRVHFPLKVEAENAMRARAKAVKKVA